MSFVNNFKLNKPWDRSGLMFERMCLTVFRHHFGAKDANFYGMNSTGQDGIDIRLTSLIEGRNERVVIQCKDTKDLTYSTYSKDFKRALEVFTPELESDLSLHFFYIVATTTDEADTADTRKKGNRLIESTVPEHLRHRIRHEVKDWKWFEATVADSEHLKEVFVPISLPGDSVFDHERNQVGIEVKNALRDNRLGGARLVLNRWYKSKNEKEDESFKWVTWSIFNDLVRLFMGAGDFERAHRLLNIGLGADPSNAEYLISQLRCNRVLSLFTRTTKPLSLEDMVGRHSRRSIEEEVDLLENRLDTLQGSVDALLTVCLWVVSYGNEALAGRALFIARGLLDHAWPDRTEPFNSSGLYTITRNANVEIRLQGNYRVIGRSSTGSDACALLLAYNYIRMSHAKRFGFNASIRIENVDHGGSWPASIGFGPDFDPLPFQFSKVVGWATVSMYRTLPLFSAEWGCRDSSTSCGIELLAKNSPQLKGYSYVCSASLLLRDCRNGQVANRMEYLRTARSWGSPPKLLISHLALERLAGVRLALAMEVNSDDTMKNYSERFIAEIDYLSQLVGRNETLGNRSYAIESCAVYGEPGRVRTVSEIDAAVALCESKTGDFIACTASEFEYAKKSIYHDAEILLYWNPLPGGAIVPPSRY